MKVVFIGLVLVAVVVLGFYLVRLQRPKFPDEPLSIQDAQKIAEKYLRDDLREMTIRSEMTREFEFGFVFYYAPKKFLETKDPMYLVPGNGPLVIDRRDRKAHPLTTSTDSDQAIEEYRKKWRLQGL